MKTTTNYLKTNLLAVTLTCCMVITLLSASAQIAIQTSESPSYEFQKSFRSTNSNAIQPSNLRSQQITHGQSVVSTQSNSMSAASSARMMPTQSNMINFTQSLYLPTQAHARDHSITPLAPPTCWYDSALSTYTYSLVGNDDGSSGPISIPFTFNMYGNMYNTIHVNNNGNITFDDDYSAFSPSGFPFSVAMVAPFWADVDTRNPVSGLVYIKVNPTNVIVTWDHVGYFAENVDLVNTFQVVISDGNDPLIGIGNNVCFHYEDMQWTTGDASGGSGGFPGVDGSPATVGINKGNDIDYVQIGRFGIPGSSYDGGGGNIDGIDYLDNQCFCFNVSNVTNQPPSVSGVPQNNIFNVNCGDKDTLTLSFLPPEISQNVNTVINTNGLCNATASTTSGAVSTARLIITGADCNLGQHTVTFTATDNFTPPAVTVVSITVNVTGTGTFYRDQDGDGYGDAGNTIQACAGPSGYVSNNTDCNDDLSSVYPGASEICGNGIDDNCNGQIDENCNTFTYYADTDGDGFGDPGNATTTNSSTPPAGYVTDNTDCNDQNAAVHPGATEVCNGVDDNCNGQIDEGVKSTFYADADGDGFGDANTSVQACTAPSGYVADNTDCNDNSAAVHPGATEVCNGVDDNCNGQIDEGVKSTFYADADGDGFGDANTSVQACTALSGYVADNTDCNDNSAAVHPGATEVCNGVDDNCNGQIDEGVGSAFYADADGDGFGDPNSSVHACTAPSGYVTDNTDCNDNSAAVHPGATEVCNGVDDNCNGQIDEGVGSAFYADADGDGFGDPNSNIHACTAPSGYVTDNTDCNDANAAVHPGATEICNGIDDNCNGHIDEGVTTTFYRDQDGDGYGDPGVTIQACTVPQGYVTNNTDCNDDLASVNPGAPEVCANNIDDNCNGQIDEGCNTCNVALDAAMDASITIGYGQQSVTRTVTPTGGTGPYTFAWTLSRPLTCDTTNSGNCNRGHSGCGNSGCDPRCTNRHCHSGNGGCCSHGCDSHCCSSCDTHHSGCNNSGCTNRSCHSDDSGCGSHDSGCHSHCCSWCDSHRSQCNSGCNRNNSGGNTTTVSTDEVFSVVGGNCSNTSCPSTGTPTCSSGGDSSTINLTLLSDAQVCVTATDANGCSATSCFNVNITDVRCPAGSCDRGANKILVCHHNNSCGNNRWEQICVDSCQVACYLSHGDYLGTCIASARMMAINTSIITDNIGILVYPNPAHDKLTVKFNSTGNDEFTFQMVDMTGRIVLNEVRNSDAGTNSVELNTSDFAKGIYILSITGTEGTRQMRIGVE